MIKAIFFDWFNTLARYEPPREELYERLLQEFGINLPSLALVKGILAGDEYFLEENSVSPIAKRSLEEQTEIYIHYNDTILTTAGVRLPREQLLKIIQKGQKMFQDVEFTLFDDVIPTLKTLKEQNYTLGLLTNLNKDMNPLCQRLGLEPYLNFVVTSREVGADKPSPRFFLTALEKAKVKPQETVHVGDQYKVDVMGARGAGINPILIDRYNLHQEVGDYPCIHTLPEIAEYL